MRKKRDLFEGLFDGSDDDVEFAAANPTALLGAVRELLSEAKPEPELILTATNAGPTPALQERTVALIESAAGLLASGSLPAELKARLAAAAAVLTNVAASAKPNR